MELTALNMSSLQWNSLSDIEDTEPINESDLECLKELKEVLFKHGKINRFGVALLHKHFDLQEGECLVEYTNAETRTLETVVKKDIEVNNAIQTLWRFDDIQFLLKCEKWCEPRTGTTGHTRRHSFKLF
jgi:hypothetical protein